jgi:uncharacterized protein YbjT (DUF2867 family)
MGGCETVLVTGATGNQGGAVTRALLDAGHRVRALTRRTGSSAALALAGAGAEVVAGDFGDPASLRAACRGADGVFVMSAPFEAGTEAEVRQATAVLEAAVEAGVGQVVFSIRADSWFPFKLLAQPCHLTGHRRSDLATTHPPRLPPAPFCRTHNPRDLLTIVLRISLVPP